jgi:hypothetical protein
MFLVAIKMHPSVKKPRLFLYLCKLSCSQTSEDHLQFSFLFKN